MRSRLGVTHYLCVKCGELSMKVVWQAEMAMVWRLAAISYHLNQSSVLRERNRKIQPVSSGDCWCFGNPLHNLCSFSGNPWESDTGGNTLIWNWTPPREYSVTLLNSNHLLYFKVECCTTLFLMQSICSGGGLKDRRRWIVTCDYCWQVQKGVMWHKS